MQLKTKVESTKNVRILSEIKEGKFKPQPYEEIDLSSKQINYLDKIIELNLKPRIPTTKEIYNELGISRFYNDKFREIPLASNLLINPTIIELLAVFGIHGTGRPKWTFENRTLDYFLSNDIGDLSRTSSRNVRTIHKSIEMVNSGNTGYRGARSKQYYIATVSVDSIPVYSKFLP